jgi:SpoIID/LytB domain protein
VAVLTGAIAGILGGLAREGRAADDVSGADKLRTLYSAQFQFTAEGLPIVPVAVADAVAEVTVSGEGGLVVRPDGEGGAELLADDAWTVRATGTTPAKLRFHTIVARARLSEDDAASATAAATARAWEGRGEKARVFEHGALFGVSGEVLDRREVLVAVGPAESFEAAERAAERLGRKAPLTGRGVFTELVDRPHGFLHAVGKRSGARLRNEGVLWFAPTADRPLRVEWAPAAGSGPARPRGQGLFHGTVYVTIDRRGQIAIVNAVPEDRLLAGLVPAEIFPSAPDEALKAQAVAARGELLAKIGTRHVGDPYRLCSTTHCQVYGGAGRETPRTTAAVLATRGEVLFTADRKDLVDTVYSAACGGHTEHNENVWPDQPRHATLRGRRDAAPSGGDPFAGGITAANLGRFLAEAPPAYCAQASQGAGDRYRWTVTRTAAELDKLLAALPVGRVRSIEVQERGVSGRARVVKVTGTRGSEVVRGELRIRLVFGGLRSSLFVVDVKDGAATFRGAGYGHGVGLCQTGAIGMAEAGKPYREILRHYYQGSVLRKLW